MKNILFFLATVLLTIGCISDLKTGVPFESISIEMAKENKVINSVYKANINQIINKGKVIKIIEVWSENSWCYKDKNRNIKKFKNINFIIRFDKELEEITSLKGKRPNEKNRSLGTTNFRLFTDLSKIEQIKDTLVFLFQSDKGIIPIRFIKIPL